jgi:hypothetical protein
MLVSKYLTFWVTWLSSRSPDRELEPDSDSTILRASPAVGGPRAEFRTKLAPDWINFWHGGQQTSSHVHPTPSCSWGVRPLTVAQRAWFAPSGVPGKTPGNRGWRGESGRNKLKSGPKRGIGGLTGPFSPSNEKSGPRELLGETSGDALANSPRSVPTMLYSFSFIKHHVFCTIIFLWNISCK